MTDLVRIEGGPEWLDGREMPVPDGPSYLYVRDDGAAGVEVLADPRADEDGQGWHVVYVAWPVTGGGPVCTWQGPYPLT